jgi:hypothetical protein
MRLISIGGLVATVIWTGAALAPGAAAETLDLTCTAPGTSQTQHVAIDLGTGLVRNDIGGSGRPWAAKVTDANISWDEVFDSRIGHTANHFVLDRSTGALHRTDMTHAQPVSETLNVLCQKAP